MPPAVSVNRPAKHPLCRGRWLAAPMLALVGLLILSPDALANCCTVKSGGSPNANAISSLYNIVFYISLVVFFAVVGLLVYSIYKFRAHKNPVATQIHGNARLEIGMTLTAAGILVILAAVTFIKLPSIINPPNSDPAAYSALTASLTQPTPPNGKKLTVCVTGRQFIWRYTYGAKCNESAWQNKLPYSYQEMVVPAGVTVSLVIQSSDVTHAWWVPQLGGKVDAVPGYTTYTWFKPLHSGQLYRGQCAQLCGRQHAFMTALVKVVTPRQYRHYLATLTTEISQQNDLVGQLRNELIRHGDLTSNGTD
jgi:cytochrome c oxidase subunit II